MSFRPLLVLLFPALLTADQRVERLHQALAGRPLCGFSEYLVETADRYHLDWRLLPAIAIAETSGGRARCRRNNWFGWNNGHARFGSIREGIRTVARHLAEEEPYRGRPLTQKLGFYNRRRSYRKKIQVLMAEIQYSKVPIFQGSKVPRKQGSKFKRHPAASRAHVYPGRLPRHPRSDTAASFPV